MIYFELFWKLYRTLHRNTFSPHIYSFFNISGTLFWYSSNYLNFELPHRNTDGSMSCMETGLGSFRNNLLPLNHQFPSVSSLTNYSELLNSNRSLVQRDTFAKFLSFHKTRLGLSKNYKFYKQSFFRFHKLLSCTHAIYCFRILDCFLNRKLYPRFDWGGTSTACLRSNRRLWYCQILKSLVLETDGYFEGKFRR